MKRVYLPRYDQSGRDGHDDPDALLISGRLTIGGYAAKEGEDFCEMLPKLHKLYTMHANSQDKIRCTVVLESDGNKQLLSLVSKRQRELHRRCSRKIRAMFRKTEGPIIRNIRADCIRTARKMAREQGLLP
jgi:hypothetical protein